MQEERRKQGERGWRNRGEQQHGFIWLTDALQLLYPLSSLLSHPLSCRAPWAQARQLIPLTFTLLSQPSSDANPAAAAVCTHNGLRWMRDSGWCRRWTTQPLTWAQPMMRPLETLSEPGSCILCYILQYVLNKIGLVWVEEYQKKTVWKKKVKESEGEGRTKWEIDGVRNLQIFHSSVPKYALGI